MKPFFDKVLNVEINKELGIVQLSIKVTETQVTIYKIPINDFIAMIADFNSQLAE